MSAPAVGSAALLCTYKNNVELKLNIRVPIVY
jgi:hypothetical protein